MIMLSENMCSELSRNSCNGVAMTPNDILKQTEMIQKCGAIV